MLKHPFEQISWFGPKEALGGCCACGLLDEEVPEYGLGKIEYGGESRSLAYRNTGAPTSGLPGKESDLDIWTPRDQGRFTWPSQDTQQQLGNIFGVEKMDNYNRWWGYDEPPGAVTFDPSGSVTRNVAPWQLPPHTR